MLLPGYPSGQQLRPVQPEGDGSSGILLLGEAPEKTEQAELLPFRPWADAGSVLERALTRVGLPRAQCLISNICWYQPPNNWLDGAPWERDMIEFCRPELDKLIAQRNIKVIVALGGIAMRELTGLAGKKAGIGMTRGFICESRYGIPVVGTYHPAFLHRGSKDRESGGAKGKVNSAGGGTQGMALLGVLIRDIMLAKEVAEGRAKLDFTYDDYILGGDIINWKNALKFLRAHPDLSISYDFETFDSTEVDDETEVEHTNRHVTQVQISWRPGQALVSAWFPELLPVLKEILELPNPKLDWNGRGFDRPILKALGIRTDIGEWHDGMNLFHHAQPDLPRGLQYATSFTCPEVGPWKHFSDSKPLWYGALDVDMPQRILEHQKSALSKIKHPVSGRSLWDGYMEQVVGLAPVLDRMTERGIPVSEPRRQELDLEFTATQGELKEKCQGLYPPELLRVHPKEGFVRPPEEVVEECPVCKGKKKIRVDGERKLQPCDFCAGAGKVNRITPPPDFSQRVFPVKGEPVLRWCKVLEFNPGSSDQVKDYLYWSREKNIKERVEKLALKAPQAHLDVLRATAESRCEWVIPKDHKTKKDTTGADELRRLAKKVGDPLLPLVIEYKEIQKMRGTYVDGWAPGSDGRVHPFFGFKPATAQLSSENPNAQNFPAHGRLAEKMKSMLVSAEEE